MTEYVGPGFAKPRYLLIYTDRFAVSEFLTEDMAEALQDGSLRVVDMDEYAEVAPDLTLHELEDETPEIE